MPIKPRSQALGDFFLDQAAWRDAKAREFPDDPRNRRAADGLKELADHVRRMPSDDPRIRAVDRVGAFDPIDGRLMVGDQALRWASSFRFNRPQEAFDPFLRVFLDLLREDRERYAESEAQADVMTEVVIEVQDPQRGSVRKKFIGKMLVQDYASSDPEVDPGVVFTVYETQGGRYAVHSHREGREGRLDVYDDVLAMEEDFPADLIAQLGGEPPIELLDI